jgi:hypothetical protein
MQTFMFRYKETGYFLGTSSNKIAFHEARNTVPSVFATLLLKTLGINRQIYVSFGDALTQLQPYVSP